MREGQQDLFGSAPLPGLKLGLDLVTRSEEEVLTRAIDAAGLAPFRFHGWLGKRQTVSYGTSYDLDTGRLTAAAPIPAWLSTIRAEAAAFAGISFADIQQALAIRYDPSAGIGWHCDRRAYEHVVGISLGTSATMRFRRRIGAGFERVDVPLPARSIYHLSGEARHDWEHSIAPLGDTRWSITFRSLSAMGRDALVRLSPHRLRST